MQPPWPGRLLASHKNEPTATAKCNSDIEREEHVPGASGRDWL